MNNLVSQSCTSRIKLELRPKISADDIISVWFHRTNVKLLVSYQSLLQYFPWDNNGKKGIVNGAFRVFDALSFKWWHLVACRRRFNSLYLTCSVNCIVSSHLDNPDSFSFRQNYICLFVLWAHKKCTAIKYSRTLEGHEYLK